MSELFYLYPNAHYLVPEKLGSSKESSISEVDLLALESANTIVLCAHLLTDDDRILLGKILEAVQLNVAEVPVFYSISDELKRACFKNQHEKHLMVFGLNPKELGLQIEAALYDLVQINNKKILFSHALNDLKERERKVALWSALKGMFKR